VCAPNALFQQLVTKQKRTPPRAVAAGEQEGRFEIRENGLTFVAGFGEGPATGIFLDQRENRRRLLEMGLQGKRALNCFAYTCAFSVAAAKAGATVTSVDLSKRHLEWGRENFRANGLDDRTHDFVFGDVFEWLKRFARRGQSWDVVLLDPPTFSTTKKGRAFRAARDYLELEALAIPVVAPEGRLFCSTNQRTLAADQFEAILREAVRRCGRVTASVEYETLPFDFRLAARERPYLKTFWVQL
jgi:23S rRNA (cytosine1962-C5)-methyltransferase